MGNLKPRGFYAIVPPEELAAFQPRHQQICPCEVLPALYIPDTVPEIIAGSDIVWFIDNQAAIASLVKGSSSQADISAIVAVVHFNFARLGLRVYFESIDSDLTFQMDYQEMA